MAIYIKQERNDVMFYEEKISWINSTPLGIRIRNIEFVPTHIHEKIVEIIFCLKGNIKFSYGFEEFNLSAGEFITVDKDAHFLFGGKEDNICISFYINLEWFSEKYTYITSLLFVCEGTRESSKPYPTYYHKQMRGTLVAILFYLSNHENFDNDFQNTIINGVERIIDLLVHYFDLAFFYNPNLILKKELMERNRTMMAYLYKHSTEKITLETMAHEFNLTKSYLSEFLRTFEIGFRRLLGYIRANNSEKLLMTTDLNIMDISEACGFSDPKYYHSAFKEWYKCTPSQFRKSYKNKMNEEDLEQELSLSDVLGPLNDLILKDYLSLFLF